MEPGLPLANVHRKHMRARRELYKSDTFFGLWLNFHCRTKWEMLRQARRSLFKNVLSATQWKEVENIRPVQISAAFLAEKQDKYQDFLIPMQTKTKVKTRQLWERTRNFVAKKKAHDLIL
ncbi:hypothetical protein Cadr_000007023 [Camelus dromedarius]|uniref:Uncharacterized protein n=1 Tax=Camelus dromedarius TaxID=9838 RepID=A0A5N4E4T9_CAMDR|nr:hypothetical protein Cadr_000007023 [Camelus dromedarius]